MSKISGNFEIKDAGMNLGEIIESGSNVNGKYIKYGNGILMQYGTIGISAGKGNEVVTLPTPFKDTVYYIILSNRYSNSPLLVWSYGNVDRPTFEVFVRNVNSGSTTPSSQIPSVAAVASWLAIGRWK